MTDGTDLLFEVKLKNEYVDGTVTGSVNNESSLMKLGNHTYRLTKASIFPNNLNLCYPFVLKKDGVEVFSVNISPMYFIYQVLEYSSDVPEKEAMAALYDYWYATH